MSAADQLFCTVDADAANSPAIEQTPRCNLPDDFWRKRPLFGAIRRYAWSNLVSANALLLALIARTAAMRSPTVKLVTGGGPSTSLNMIVAVVCGSGIGKSKACRVAARALPLPADCLDMLPIGSGEGLAEVFMGNLPSPSDNGEKRGSVRNNAHFFVDEGELLLNLFERRGSTIAETIRRMFADAPLGQTNAHAETSRRVADYSLVITVATTFAPAGRILAMSESGTAQRFLWAHGIDASANPKPGAPAPVFRQCRGRTSP